jgi:hypothetical protein
MHFPSPIHEFQLAHVYEDPHLLFDLLGLVRVPTRKELDLIVSEGAPVVLY